MTARLSALALAGVLLVGCDSSSVPDLRLTCEDVSLSSSGTLTASTPSGSFRANCFEVSSRTSFLTIEGLDVDLVEGGIDGSISLDIRGTTPGTYSVDEDAERQVEASYSPSGSVSLEAVSGTVTLSEFSTTRVRGSFSFETTNGSRVTDGAFDVEL